MLNFKIDDSKCIRCEKCVKDCVAGIITMNDLPQIEVDKEDQCIKCQHCLAVCPTGALSILGVNPENSIPVKDKHIDFNQLSEMIKTRRSIRKFNSEELNLETLEKLTSTAVYAPTGHNDNGVMFHLTKTKDETDKIKELLYTAIRKANEKKPLTGFASLLAKMQHVYNAHGVDLIFREAPHFLIATVPSNHTTPKEDAVIALSYFEILANSMGIGTLWNGLSLMAIALDETIKEDIGIPADHKIGYAMVFGKPAVKYSRSIQKNESHLRFISI